MVAAPGAGTTWTVRDGSAARLPSVAVTIALTVTSETPSGTSTYAEKPRARLSAPVSSPVLGRLVRAGEPGEWPSDTSTRASAA